MVQKGNSNQITNIHMFASRCLIPRLEEEDHKKRVLNGKTVGQQQTSFCYKLRTKRESNGTSSHSYISENRPPQKRISLINLKIA